MSKLGKVCKHGSLARQCEICDLQSQLQTTQDKLERAKKVLKMISQDATFPERAMDLAEQMLREIEGAENK